MTEEIAKQRIVSTKLQKAIERSVSVKDLRRSQKDSDFDRGDDIESYSEADLALAAEIENQGRRALYGSLPFFSAFGMEGRERSVKKLLKAASCSALHNLVSSENEVLITLFTLHSEYTPDTRTHPQHRTAFACWQTSTSTS